MSIFVFFVSAGVFSLRVSLIHSYYCSEKSYRNLSSLLRSSLENCTSNSTRQHDTTRYNTRQHEYNTTQQETTQVQHKPTPVQREITRVQHDTTRGQRETTQVQYKYKGSWGSKNRALLCIFFFTEIYIFLISFRNS